MGRDLVRTAHRPPSGAKAGLFGVVGGFLFGDADPVAGIVVGKAGEDVEMDIGDAGSCEIEGATL